MTDAEKRLWYQLRAKRFSGYKFRRQVPMQRYIADFICYNPKLLIELDGGQHASHEDYDKKRDRFFVQQGFTVLRFWNNDVMQHMDTVLQHIMDRLELLGSSPLSLTLPHKGEGNKKEELV